MDPNSEVYERKDSNSWVSKFKQFLLFRKALECREYDDDGSPKIMFNGRDCGEYWKHYKSILDSFKPVCIHW